MNIDYSWLPGNLAPESLCEECSELFSTQYGKWSAHDPDGRGRRSIRFSPRRIRRLLISPDSRIAYARYQGCLIGYAIAVQTNVPRYGIVSWVTQLVVHADHRHSGVGKTLLFSIWQFSSHFAWGLTSANPYAVRALEKATRRRCLPERILRNARKLSTVGASHIPYIGHNIEYKITQSESRVNTAFFVDHSTLPTKLASASAKAQWLLGDLPEGWEWFAFTFHDQQQLNLSKDEIRAMLDACDDITRQAYTRMTIGDEHRWARHTDKEALFVVENCNLPQGQSVLDLGCGRGRHAVALAKHGLSVTGVDYAANLIAQARVNVRNAGVPGVELIHDDCRSIRVSRRYNAVICLYDVVGTYAENTDNARILKSMYVHLIPGGYALLSVMNFGLTKRLARNFFSLTSEPDKLLTLPAGRVMETTGDIFDPRYYMIDTDTHVVYRKEQFAEGQELPLELIVRDRRFENEEIVSLCKAAGLEIVWSRYVQAGRWEVPLNSTDHRAKEILVLCRRPQ